LVAAKGRYAAFCVIALSLDGLGKEFDCRKFLTKFSICVVLWYTSISINQHSLKWVETI